MQILSQRSEAKHRPTCKGRMIRPNYIIECFRNRKLALPIPRALAQEQVLASLAIFD